MTRWGMTIDTDRCTGCEACVVACHEENNIATVGEEQAAMGRANHWLRIERYYEGDFPDTKVRFIARESALLIRLSGFVEGLSEDKMLEAAAELGEMQSIRGRILLEELRDDRYAESACKPSCC